jgi:hypothetical protein
VGDGWNYTGLKALNSGRKVRFLVRLSRELFRWTRSVTENYNEFPVGHTEWTLVGHMNIVAASCDYMPYTDYVVKLVKGKRSIPEGIVRPDLDVHNNSWEDSWMFEVKKEFISLITGTDLGNHILKKMKQNYDKLQRIVMGSAEVLSDNICSTVAFTVWVDALVRNKDNKVEDWWEKRWVTAKGYYDDWKELWKTFQTAVNGVNNQHNSFGRIYYSGYRMPYPLVRKEYQMGVQQVNKGLQPEVRIPVAMLWVFAHKRWSEIRVS